LFNGDAVCDAGAAIESALAPNGVDITARTECGTWRVSVGGVLGPPGVPSPNAAKAVEGEYPGVASFWFGVGNGKC
jgi:hypothetical protein